MEKSFTGKMEGYNTASWNKYKPNAYNVWKTFLVLIGCFFFLHFLKDITQDILNIPTLLDKMGNIVENPTNLPAWLQYVYHWGWVNTTLSQPVITYLSFKNLKNRKFNRYDKYLILLLVHFCLMIFWAYYLSIK